MGEGECLSEESDIYLFLFPLPLAVTAVFVVLEERWVRELRRAGKRASSESCKISCC